MRKPKIGGSGHAVGAAFGALLAVAAWIGAAAHAEDTESSTSSALTLASGPRTIPGLPTAAAGAGTAGLNSSLMALQFSQCEQQQSMNMLSSGLTGMGTGLASGGGLLGGVGAGISGWAGSVSLEAPCPPAAGDSNTAPTCEQLSPGGVFSETQLSTYRNNAMMTLANLLCQKGKMQLLSSRLNCMQNIANTIRTQLQQFQDQFTTGIQAMQQYVFQEKELEEDLQVLADNTDKLLKGADGQKGLEQMAQELDTLVKSQINSDIQSLEEQHERISNNSAALEARAAASTSTKTAECVGTMTNASWDCHCEGAGETRRCGRRGTPVSATAYISCVVESRSLIGKDGATIERGSRTRAEAERRATGLTGLLERIIQTAPQASQAGGGGTQTSSINTSMSADAIKKKYGTELAAYNVPGVNVLDFVSQTFGYCNRKSEAEVLQERTTAGTTLHQEQEAIEADQRDAAKKANDFMDGYNTVYRDALKALTGRQASLPLSACRNGQPGVQMQCLQDIRTEMRGLLDGGSAAGTVTVSITGRKNGTRANVPCSGVADCVAQLQLNRDDFKNKKQQVTDRKQAQIFKANQDLDRAVQLLAVSQQQNSRLLQSQLSLINTSMASLGISPGVDIQPVASERFTPDADGLYGPPQSIYNVIGSSMEPPMLDVQGNSFAGSLGGVATKSQEIETQLGQAMGAGQRLDALASDCRAKARRDAVAALGTQAQAVQSAIDRFRSGNCYYPEAQVCPNSGSDGLSSVITAVDDATSAGLDASVASNLSTGVDGMCTMPRRISVGGTATATAVEISPNCQSLYTSVTSAASRLGSSARSLAGSSSGAGR